jgi:hypothetical protein
MGIAANRDLLAEFKQHLSKPALSPAIIVNDLADVRAFASWDASRSSPEAASTQASACQLREYCWHIETREWRTRSTIHRWLQALRRLFRFAQVQGQTGQNRGYTARVSGTRSIAPCGRSWTGTRLLCYRQSCGIPQNRAGTEAPPPPVLLPELISPPPGTISTC